MSQWTHVTGCFRLSMSPYVKSTDNEGRDIYTLKYPKEQCKITRVGHYYEDEPTWVDMEVSSFPIAKRAIKPLIKQILPQGEDGLTWFLNQKSGDYGSSSNYFNDDSEKAIYEELCKKKFGDKYNDKDYELSGIYNNDGFTLTIADDIRYCSGDELYDAFIKLIKALDLVGIYIDSCNVEWKDEWNCNNYRITQVSYNANIILFEVKDRHTDKVIKSDIFKYDPEIDRIVKEEELSLDELLKEDY